MERKVTKFGNSLGITMTDVLKQIGLDQGDTVSIEGSPATGEIIIKKLTKVSLPKGIRADFMDTLTMTITLLWPALQDGCKKAENFTLDMVNHQFDRQQSAAIIEAHCITIPKS